jgi:hypothetical protein
LKFQVKADVSNVKKGFIPIVEVYKQGLHECIRKRTFSHLTAWSRGLLEQVIVFHTVKEFSEFLFFCCGFTAQLSLGLLNPPPPAPLPRIVWNTKYQCCFGNSLPIISVLSQLKPVH